MQEEIKKLKTTKECYDIIDEIDEKIEILRQSKIDATLRICEILDGASCNNKNVRCVFIKEKEFLDNDKYYYKNVFYLDKEEKREIVFQIPEALYRDSVDMYINHIVSSKFYNELEKNLIIEQLKKFDEEFKRKD